MKVRMITSGSIFECDASEFHAVVSDVLTNEADSLEDCLDGQIIFALECETNLASYPVGTLIEMMKKIDKFFGCEDYTRYELVD